MTLRAMNILWDFRYRALVLCVLIMFELARYTIMPNRYNDAAFYGVHIAYFFLGLLSVGWKQGIQNILAVTSPMIFLLLGKMVLQDYMHRRMSISLSDVGIVFWAWGQLFALSGTTFLLGFFSRFLFFKFLLKRLPSR